MHAKKRYALLLLCILLSIFCAVYLLGRKDAGSKKRRNSLIRRLIPSSLLTYEGLAASPLPKTYKNKENSCSMRACFDRKRCQTQFKVHIHGLQDQHLSETYSKVLQVITDSPLYTENPSEACIFVLALDTMDRDPLSANYLKDMPNMISGLAPDIWMNGSNHIIFNMYYGTWPNYHLQDIGFNVGHAMLARASSDQKYFRHGFDIALPLFHKELPLRDEGGKSEFLKPLVPLKDRYLLVFKGKRYVYGIGSETRNSLYHLHNGKDIIMLTTCKHGTDWKYMQDDRCEQDNLDYDKWDYSSLLRNSTFCLVARGRRLGSYRFLESLQAGCIPVILSDGWQLPFSEIIDWNSAVVWANETQFLHLPDILRSIPSSRILAMKQKARLLYQIYFSSVQKIVLTTLDIIRSRLQGPQTPKNPLSFPVLHNISVAAVIAVEHDSIVDIRRLAKLVASIYKSKYCRKDYAYRFEVASEFKSESVFLLDSRAELDSERIDIAVGLFSIFPARMVGFYPMNHRRKDGHWYLSTSPLEGYSMLRLDAVIINRHYCEAYTKWIPKSLQSIVQETPHCHDILFNIFVTNLTAKPPVLVTGADSGNLARDLRKLTAIERCLNSFAAHFGTVPLVRTTVTFDPVL